MWWISTAACVELTRGGRVHVEHYSTLTCASTHCIQAAAVCMFVYMWTRASTHRSTCSWLARWVTNSVMWRVGTGIMALANWGSCWSIASWTSVTAELICHWTQSSSAAVSYYNEGDAVRCSKCSFSLIFQELAQYGWEEERRWGGEIKRRRLGQMITIANQCPLRGAIWSISINISESLAVW